MLGSTQTRTRVRVRVSTSLVFWCYAALGAWLLVGSLWVPGGRLYFRSNFIGGLLGVALAFLTFPVLRWHAAIAGLCSSWIFLSITFWSPENHAIFEASTALSAAIMVVIAVVAALGLEFQPNEA
jgi:peptidoglycan/LPS O-acetylase OafA/YrhL